MRHLSALVLSVPLLAQPTFHVERTGWQETPRLAQTLEDCRALVQASPSLRLTPFGRSPQGRDLVALVADRDRDFEPAKVRARGKAVVMIQACIHPGEPEGKDAGLLFLRDLCVGGRHPELLEKLVFVFIPVLNADGHERWSAHNRINQNGPRETGWRATATNLNLNRDFLKADTPEMRAWLKLHQAWLPDLFVDCHATDGADYPYVMTYGEEVDRDGTCFLEPRLGTWVRDTFLPGFREAMTRAGIPVHPYVSFRTWHDPRSGLVMSPAGPAYSTGYQSAQNRPALLLETHMLKPYRQRVEATLAALRAVSGLAARERDRLLRLNREADAFTASPGFRRTPMPLAFTEDGTTEPAEFQGFAYTVTRSDLTGGDWFRYDSAKPETFRVPYARRMKATAQARVPEAYLVPPEWTEVIARLEAHGVRLHRLAGPRTLEVATDRFRDPKWIPEPYEGRFKLAGVAQEPLVQTRTFPAGTAVVPTDQRTARLIAHLLEPASPDSLLRWGFFNSIFEQKEYGESYVLEGLAREMLARDPALKAEFEALKARDKAFAADPEAMLNWFYLRSPWGDPQLNLYPVGRVFDPEAARRLLLP